MRYFHVTDPDRYTIETIKDGSYSGLALASNCSNESDFWANVCSYD